MTADKPGSRHQRRSLCRCLGESLDRSNSTPPTGATSRSRPPRGAFLIPRPLAVVDYCGNGYAFCVMISRKLGLAPQASVSANNLMLGWHRKNVDTPILLVTYVSSCSCSHYAHIGVTQAIDAEELRNRHWVGRKRSATSERCGMSARPPLVSTTKAPAIPGFVAQSHGLGTRRLRFTVVTSFHGTMGLLSRPMLHEEKSVTSRLKVTV